MRRAAAKVLLTLALGSIAGSVLAADIFPVGMNEGRRVILHGSAANVVVANPAVADVTMVDSHSIIILGRGYGATAIMVLDRNGRVLFDGHVRVSPPEQGLVTMHCHPLRARHSGRGGAGLARVGRRRRWRGHRRGAGRAIDARDLNRSGPRLNVQLGSRR